MSKLPIIQINIGTVEITSQGLKELEKELDTPVTAILEMLRQRITSLETRLETEDEPLKDIIYDEVNEPLIPPDWTEDNHFSDIFKRRDPNRMNPSKLEEVVVENHKDT